MAISKKVADRISSQIRRYQKILKNAKAQDVNEADTVTIIADMLADVFGYDKYKDITKEYAIRGTYCDLAVKVGSDVRFLVEAKAIGQELKDAHLRQAVNYASNQGIEWVVLTNGVCWRIYKVELQRKVEQTAVLEVDLLESKPRDKQLIVGLGNLTREGFARSSMDQFFQERQALSRFSLAALILSEPVLAVLRREIKRAAPTSRPELKTIENLLKGEVLKRDVVESEDALAAQKFVKKVAQKAMRNKKARAAAMPE